MATIKDVAELAGVSIATVSRVVKGNGNVSPKTAAKVTSAIKQLNYHPNALARQLKHQCTNNIIIIIPDISNTFFHEILHGIEETAERNDMHILIADMHNKTSIEEYYLRALMQKEVDGIISFSANVAQQLLKQAANDFPLVIACQYLDSIDIPSITIDNVAAAKEICNHLIASGKKNIAHLTALPNFLLYQDRLDGYTASLRENGLDFRAGLIRYCSPNIKSGYEQTLSLLDSGIYFDSIFAAGDTMAIGAIRALKERGISIPDECAVAGFDDIEMSSLIDPPLTTIRQPKYQIGCDAMNMLISLIRGSHIAKRNIVAEHQLVIRQSSCSVN